MTARATVGAGPRVRFAPSPTGHLHVGTARTALFNWLFARHHGGVLVLRSDDTDAERSTAESYDDILDSLRWLGIDWDEGVKIGGPHEPYRQSLRLERYREAALAMVDAGWAYHAFETADELEAMRERARAEGRPPRYDGSGRDVDPDEARRRVAAGEPAVVRFRVPQPGATRFVDAIRDEVEFDHAEVDDFIVLRSDGSPTYHLASSVDDVDFGITHVVRGEDLLSSTPKHILLGEALRAKLPITYAHLPLIRGADGAKLSKRHGDTSIRAYRDGGYVPDALVNYLALLGWSPGGDETIVSRKAMVERFDLSGVSKSPAVFDADKLEWMNGIYIRDMAPGGFVAETTPLIGSDLGRSLDDGERATYAALAPHVQERTKLLAEVPGQVRFLFGEEVGYDEASWRKVMTREDAAVAVRGAIAALEDLTPWTTGAIDAALRGMLADHELSARKGLQPIRVAVTGSTVSPPLFESLEALGRERTLARLRAVNARL